MIKIAVEKLPDNTLFRFIENGPVYQKHSYLWRSHELRFYDIGKSPMLFHAFVPEDYQIFTDYKVQSLPFKLINKNKW